MKKIFYSMAAVALCSCAQSDVEDAITPPHSENNNLKFTVVDNGYHYEDGTRVTYGDYVEGDRNSNTAAYTAKFEDGNAIGVYAIISMNDDGTPATYAFENKPLTLKNGIWTSTESFDLTNVTLLFAYAPYRSDASASADQEHQLTFTKAANGGWELNKGNNRFFVGGSTYSVTDNGTKDKFEAADWMGAAVNLTEGQKTGQETISFEMQHMRGMIELTTDKNVELANMQLRIGSETGDKYDFTPYFFNQNDANRTQNVYRILTTEYRSQNVLFVTITDGDITKKYKKAFSAESVGAGKCVCVNVNYSPVITVGAGQTLAAILTEKYGENYANSLTSLRLTGELQGASATEGDWATLRSLTKLTKLDMSQLTNTSLPNNWLKGNDAPLRTALTSLVLPNNLTTIGGDALQVTNVGNIDVPATVTEIGNGAFYWCNKTSIRIPEDSQLKTVGLGAFNGAKAVYTYENDNTTLVLPASLTSIGTDSAFGVSSLKKVIFKGETAPKIDPKAFNGTNAIINVPNDSYKNLFPEKTVYIAVPNLTAENFFSPYTTTFEGSVAGLCDNNNVTYWHSDYWEAHDYDEWGIYIDITLPIEYNNLKVIYATRSNNGNGSPVRVKLAVSNDGVNYTTAYEATGLPKTSNTTKVLDTPIAITDVTSYKYVRFAILESPSGVAENAGTGASGTNKRTFACLGELTLCQDIWTDAAAN